MAEITKACVSIHTRRKPLRGRASGTGEVERWIYGVNFELKKQK